ncbi:MAG: ZIP family metal transporter [Flavobacteriales bacterium]
MESLIRPLIILFLATWLGGGIAYILPSKGWEGSRAFLAFSGAFLFGLAFTQFFPHLFKEDVQGIGLWVLLGFFLQLLLDLFTGGIEHGHYQEKVPQHQRLYPLLIGLSLHAFLESLPLGGNPSLGGGRFLLGLTIHKIPISLALASLLLHSGMGKRGVLLAFLTFSLMAPAGIFLADRVPTLLGELPEIYSHYLFALVLGILLHVSTTILFESSEGHRFSRVKLLAVIIGFASACFFG